MSDGRDDDRLDRRRIDLAVLDYRAAERRRRWPVVLAATNVVGVIAFGGMAVQVARQGRPWVATADAAVALLMAATAVENAKRVRRQAPAASDPPPTPTDFTGLGGPSVADRLERIEDDPPA